MRNVVWRYFKWTFLSASIMESMIATNAARASEKPGPEFANNRVALRTGTSHKVVIALNDDEATPYDYFCITATIIATTNIKLPATRSVILAKLGRVATVCIFPASTA